jgi:hypothetical protein
MSGSPVMRTSLPAAVIFMNQGCKWELSVMFLVCEGCWQQLIASSGRKACKFDQNLVNFYWTVNVP